MIASLLAEAARSIRANDSKRALDHLLEAFGARRSYELTLRIVVAAARVERWTWPARMWTYAIGGCAPSKLSPMLAKLPDNESALRGLRSRALDPRIGWALLPRARAASHNSDILREAARHADDACARELARLVDPDRRRARGIVLPEPVPVFERDELDALAAVDAALSTTPADAAREAIAGAPADVAELLRGIALGSAAERDAAIARLAGDWTTRLQPCMPFLLELLDLPGQPRARLLGLFALPRERRGPLGFASTERDGLDEAVYAGRYRYLALIDDADPEVRIAAAYVCTSTIAGDAAEHEYELRKVGLDAAVERYVRATFLIAAAGVDGYRIDRFADWPVEDPDPFVADAAAMAEAIRRRQAVRRRALQRIARVPAGVRCSPRQFPWLGGDVAGFARAIEQSLELRPVDEVLSELEAGIRAGADRAGNSRLHLEWLAQGLMPRVLDDTPLAAAELSLEQRRLAVVLRHLVPSVADQRGLGAISSIEARAALGIATRPISVGRPLALSEWTRDDDDALSSRGTGIEVPGVCLARRFGGATVGARVSARATPHRDAFAGTGLVGLAGDEALVAWLLAGGACETVRVLSLQTDAIAKLADVPMLDQIRRLSLFGRGDAIELLASPRLRGLEAVVCRCPEPAALAALARLPALRELCVVDTPRSFELDASLERMLAGSSAPLRRLELRSLRVPIEAIAANPAFAGLEELVVDDCALVGGDGFAGLAKLRRLSAARSSFDDRCGRALARCPALETVDLVETALRAPDVVESLARGERLARLALPQRCAVDLAIAGRALRAVAVPTLAELRDWRPVAPRRVVWPNWHGHASVEAAVAAATRDGRWPHPPAGLSRRFVVDELAICGWCDGSGRAPDGWCGQHADPRHLHHDGPLPYEIDQVSAIATWSAALAAAESLAATIAAQLTARGCGTPRELVWQLSSAPRPASLVDELAGTTELADTSWWAHASLHDHPGDPLLAAAAEIVDLGFGIRAITPDAIHLETPPHPQRRI